MILTILTFILAGNISYGQGFEYDVFKTICEKISEQNDNYKLKAVLAERIILVVDPVMDKYSLYYRDTSDVYAKEILYRYNEHQLIEKLKDYDVQIKPVSKIIVIIDTTTFFSKEYRCNISGQDYLVTRSAQKEYSSNVFKTVVRDNYIYVAITVPGTHSIIYYSFSLKNGKIEFIKKGLTDDRPHNDE